MAAPCGFTLIKPIEGCKGFRAFDARWVCQSRDVEAPVQGAALKDHRSPSVPAESFRLGLAPSAPPQGDDAPVQANTLSVRAIHPAPNRRHPAGTGRPPRRGLGGAPFQGAVGWETELARLCPRLGEGALPARGGPVWSVAGKGRTLVFERRPHGSKKRRFPRLSCDEDPLKFRRACWEMQNWRWSVSRPRSR